MNELEKALLGSDENLSLYLELVPVEDFRKDVEIYVSKFTEICPDCGNADSYREGCNGCEHYSPKNLAEPDAYSLLVDGWRDASKEYPEDGQECLVFYKNKYYDIRIYHEKDKYSYWDKVAAWAVINPPDFS